MGSIEPYDTSSGRRYRVRYRDAERRQRERKGFVRKKDAEDYLSEQSVALRRGEWIDPKSARETVGELGTVWLAQQTHLKPSSLRPLEIAWRLYVQPRWGDVRVSDVRHSEVQTWISQQDRGATTVRRVHGVLAAILDVAVKDRRILVNPGRGVNLPRKVRKERHYLTHEQVTLLAGEAKEKGVLVLFLAYTGLRWGEATGLRVKDYDALRRRVSVSQNAVNVGGCIVVGTPKTHAARSVPVPAFLSVPLARACEGKTRDQLVFGAGLDHLRSPTTRDGWFIQAKKRARAADSDFPSELTLHDLRHTAASLAISAGANVKAVQRMLGHASAAMTLDTYADLFDDDLDAVATALDAARSSRNVGDLWAVGSPE